MLNAVYIGSVSERRSRGGVEGRGRDVATEVQAIRGGVPETSV